VAFSLAFAFLVALVLSFMATWTVRTIASKFGWATAPASERHIHNVPVPRLGGVGIFASFSITVLIFFAVSMLARHSQTFPWVTLFRLLLPGVLVFMLGLLDDLRTIGPYQKFAGETVAALLLWVGGLRIEHIPLLFGAGDLHYFVSIAATILWVLWITNAFNLIDGIDGLAGGSALLSTLVIFVVCVFFNSHMGAFATVILAGAILGFLRFNFNPATIFLGDCGSLFIGFMLSALALTNSEKSSTMIAVAIPIVSFGLPVLETALSVARRFVSGRPLFEADREHIHHKLLDMGFSQREVVVILYGVTALFGALSLLLLQPGARPVVTVLFVVAVGIWIGIQRLGYREWEELVRVAQRTLEQKDVMINNMSFRRVACELQAASDFAGVRNALQKSLANNEFDCCELSIGHTPRDNTDSPAAPDQRVIWRWQKPRSQTYDTTKEHEWSMSFALVDSNGTNRGTLSLYRNDVKHPLMVDVNVITNCGFHHALADALERVSIELEPTAGQSATPSVSVPN
jgi:UDP-GlcNAc:undecaprenyl-phosphate GlcNAc-1-phosphate transferase